MPHTFEFQGAFNLAEDFIGMVRGPADRQLVVSESRFSVYRVSYSRIPCIKTLAKGTLDFWKQTPKMPYANASSYVPNVPLYDP